MPHKCLNDFDFQLCLNEIERLEKLRSEVERKLMSLYKTKFLYEDMKEREYIEQQRLEV